MSTLDTYRRLAPDHPVWQQRPTGPDAGEPLACTASRSGTAPGSGTSPGTGPVPGSATVPGSGEDGSLITEYGLLAIVAATVAAAVIAWASDGAMASLFDSLLQQARGLVGG